MPITHPNSSRKHPRENEARFIRRIAIPALFLLAGFGVYWNSLSGPFIFDDLLSIRDNPRIRTLWPIWEGLTTTSRPVVWLTFAFNYSLGRLDVAGYHVLNVAIHVAASLALFGVVRRTLVTKGLRHRYESVSTGLAMAVGLLWLVHPLQTNAVNYIVQRAESLMSLFYLLTLYCVIRGATGAAGDRWFLAAVGCCALGTASKPIMVTAPIMVLLYDIAFLAKSVKRSFRERFWLYLGLAASWALVPVLLHNGAREWKPDAGFGFGGVSAWQYALSQPSVIVHYLRLSFWPQGLCLDYGWPAASNLIEVIPGGIVVALLLTATFWLLRRKHPVGFVGVWFFLILLPSSSVIPIRDLAFEHRMYLPLAALITAFVIGAYEVLEFLRCRWKIRREKWVLFTVGLLASMVAVLGFATVKRNEVYATELSIWQDTAIKRPSNPRAQYNLGVAYYRLGDITNAQESFSKAVALKDDYPDAHYSLCVVLVKQGQKDDAARHCLAAAQSRPTDAAMRNKVAQELVKLGMTDDAVAQYKEAIRIRPNFAEAYNSLGGILFDQEHVDDAIAHFRSALRYKAPFPEAHHNLGLALYTKGNLQEAIRQYSEAIRFKPDFPEAHNNLGAALFEQGKIQEAVKHFSEALRLKPDYRDAQGNLAVASAELERKSQLIPDKPSSAQ